MRRNPTWILALGVIAAMAFGGWVALRPRETLTILVLLQRKYESFPVAASIDDGIELALEEVGHRAGRYRLAVKKMDTRPDFDFYIGVEEGAQEAISNPQIIAVIGPSNDHSPTIAAQLNRAGVLMVAPDERQAELTKPGFGYGNTSPECYRPSGELNFFRVVPDDEVLERGCAEWAWKRGARTVCFLGRHEGGRRSAFLHHAARLGMTRVELQGEVADASPDLVILTADDIHWSEGVVREARCLGWDGLALYMDEPEEGHWRGWLNLPEGLVAICRTAPPAEFARKFAARFNRPADRAAWYGYRAASTVVEAVDRSRSKDRNEIRRVCAHLPTFDRTGDTLSNGLDVSVVQGGSLRVTETFTPAPRPPDKPKPRLTISFHGTLDSHVDAAYKGMVHLDMKGTFYIDPARLDTEEGAAAVDVERLRSWGHEIVAGAPGGGTVSPGKTLDEARSVVDRALADGKHIELLFEGDLDKYEFRELCEYINSKGVLVVPARERTR